nr:unnamed protein product [Digitaria exilis]
MSSPRGFDLHELSAATSNFADENKLGRGGFGPVYRGYLRDLDLDVAIKVLIVLDIGSGLLYLHRDCEKCIVHGDIKPANVMLDVSHNAKLGDFGLARLVEHGGEPKTTQVVAGTLGYIDPEFINNRWPHTESDVYSFRIVLLEIACGKRPASRQPNGASSLLAWVHNLYSQT